MTIKHFLCRLAMSIISMACIHYSVQAQSILTTEKNISYDHTGNSLSSCTYDAMGNLAADTYKNLQFCYNLANLPSKVEGLAGSANAGLTLNYGYLSDGTKTSALVSSGSSTEGLKYRGSFVYELKDGTERLSSIAWSDGRIEYFYAPPLVPEGEGEGGGDLMEESDELLEVADQWFVIDHLGSTRAVVSMSQGGAITEQNEYLPFGTRISGPAVGESNRYRFSGKEEQRFGSLDLTLSDFGARYYDPYTCRWTTRDPLAGKYHSLSPYSYCAGNPVNLVDPKGNDIYFLFYTTGNSRGDEMFKAAAETRKREIENSDSFNANKDLVVLKQIKDLASLSSVVTDIVNSFSADYGQTKEFSIWSHGGKDGPVGSEPSSAFSLDSKQMTIEGWSTIDFNWASDASANFFGCKTGRGTPSFSTQVSGLANFNNVTVNGQQSSAYPSIFTNYQTNNPEIIKGVFAYPTYMVGGNHLGIIGRHLPTSRQAVPMSSSRNGVIINNNYFQKGKKK